MEQKIAEQIQLLASLIEQNEALSKELARLNKEIGEMRQRGAFAQPRSIATGDQPPRKQWLGKNGGSMPSLKQAVAEMKAQQEPTLRRNPEIDAMLDPFVAETSVTRSSRKKS